MNFNSRFQSIKRILLITGYIFIIVPATAQKEYDFLGKGARAAGMAYAFSAIADDATAISWNPAGIVQIKKPEIAFSNSITFTDNRNTLWSDLNYQPGYVIDYAGIVYPFKWKKKDLAFGISFQNEMNYKYNYSNDKNIIINQKSNHKGKNNVTVNSVSLCGAFSITRFLSFGFSFNQWFSLGNKANSYSSYNTKLFDSLNYEYEKSVYTTTENFNFHRCNYSGGVLLDFAPYNFPLRVALKLDSKFALCNDYEVSHQSDYIYNNNVDTTWLDALKGTEKYFFPVITSIGLSYRFNDYLTIACDYDIRPFKENVYTWEFNESFSYSASDRETYLWEIDTIYAFNLLKANENLNQFRIGVEYILHPKFALIPVRAGLKNNPTSINSYNESKLTEKQVFAHSINVGCGVVTRRFSIDLAYELYKYDRIDADLYRDIQLYHFLVLSAILFLN